MHTHPASIMVSFSLQEFLALLPSKMADVLVLSDAWVVKLISWFFITLALCLGMPIAMLIFFDFFLWICRLVFPTKQPTVSSRARRRPAESATSKGAPGAPSNHQQHQPITPS